MKCRRSKTSRGARLRELAAAKLRKPTADANAAIASAEPRAWPAPAPASELRIDGPTQGAISYEGTVVVGPRGEVKGGITATIIVVEGSVQGDLRATQTVRIAASGCRRRRPVIAPRRRRARRPHSGPDQHAGRPAHGHAAELDEHKVAELLAGA